MPIVIRKSVVVVPPGVREAYWRGAPYVSLMKETAQDMGDQARVNVIKFGEPGGRWPQLQGFNSNVDRTRRIKALRDRASQGGVGAAIARRKMAQEQREQARSAGARAERKQVNREIKNSPTPALRLRALVLPHLGYARRKAAGKTPGRGKFGPDVRLRDTGALFAGLDGDLRYVPTGARITLVARGKNAGRPSNQDLLEFHALGMGNNPVRNPASDMGLFMDRTRVRWRAFIAGAPGTNRA